MFRFLCFNGSLALGGVDCCGGVFWAEWKFKECNWVSNGATWWKDLLSGLLNSTWRQSRKEKSNTRRLQNRWVSEEERGICGLRGRVELKQVLFWAESGTCCRDIACQHQHSRWKNTIIYFCTFPHCNVTAWLKLHWPGLLIILSCTALHNNNETLGLFCTIAALSKGCSVEQFSGGCGMELAMVAIQ